MTPQTQIMKNLGRGAVRLCLRPTLRPLYTSFNRAIMDLVAQSEYSHGPWFPRPNSHKYTLQGESQPAR